MDDDGYVLEGPTMNLAIVTHGGEFVVPPFDHTLGGITIQRVLELLPDVRPPPRHSLCWPLPSFPTACATASVRRSFHFLPDVVNAPVPPIVACRFEHTGPSNCCLPF